MSRWRFRPSAADARSTSRTSSTRIQRGASSASESGLGQLYQSHSASLVLPQIENRYAVRCSPSKRDPSGASMKDLAARALDTAQAKGAEYADVRVECRASQSITVKNGRVEA